MLITDKIRTAWIYISFSKVGYGDFTEEAGSQTSFLCPELTIRQLRRRRLPDEKTIAPESVGRVVPALKHALPCERFGKVNPYLTCGYQLPEEGGGKRRKRACFSSSKSTGEGAAHKTGPDNLTV